ncbi:unnamed protein product [Ranitomeya imitator]|uniref:ribonuclease H n=1 Tax=Ranitomeya imitator TaxID=111125 RepID=A0ABN9LUY5_9NEOB|nr:unnamed protein product [Ranitomeya imitator]
MAAPGCKLLVQRIRAGLPRAENYACAGARKRTSSHEDGRHRTATPIGLDRDRPWIGRRLRERKPVHHLAVLPELKPEPTQCDRTLTRVERQEHRRLNGLCFYCGDSTHAISDCPKRTKRFARSATIGTVQSKFLLSVTLICSLSSYSVMAFVDSGAALNLMDLEYARRCGFFLEPLQCPIPLRGIDATPLAKNKPQYWTQLTMCMAPAHQEVIRFLVLHNLHDVVVLGLPWLQAHNPVLDWKSMSVSSWGCQGVHGDVPFLSISSSTPSEVPEFLSDYRDVFDEPKSNTLPPHRDCDCAINLIPGSKFPKGRLFNLSVPEHAAMRSYVKESLEKGHIRPSSSPLGAGFFFVAKKDGSLRPCIDYRLLNKITVKFQYPLPLLSDLFARIKGASWFTKIDLRGAYNLVRIKQGDEWKTAFNTPEGHFEYLVMPFGLANAPSVFQSFMHDIFREYLDKFLIVYLDDILIFSDDWESHVKQVRTVFQVLRANSLFVKGSKCLFGVQKVSFLGFIFSPSTIEMDPVKVQAIHDWTQPTSLKSLQKFLGFANFYRRFICNFSSIAKPLTDLTKKGADVVNWSSAAVEAFQELKRRFSSAPVLCQPDVSLPFQVEVDASEIGAGAVLSQRGGRIELSLNFIVRCWLVILESLTNGQTERTNQTLETYLSLMQVRWSRYNPQYLDPVTDKEKYLRPFDELSKEDQAEWELKVVRPIKACPPGLTSSVFTDPAVRSSTEVLSLPWCLLSAALMLRRQLGSQSVDSAAHAIYISGARQTATDSGAAAETQCWSKVKQVSCPWGRIPPLHGAVMGSEKYRYRKFTNMMMKGGDKILSRQIMNKTLEKIKRIQLDKYYKASPEDRENIECNPYAIFHQAVEKCTPIIGLTSILKGGKSYQVPVPLTEQKRRFMAMKWIITEGREKKARRTLMYDRLADILLEAFRGEGNIIKRKNDLHKMAEANRAFAHFRWW